MATAVAAPGRIGPNAIIRVGEALVTRVGEARMAALFRQSGLGGYVAALPEHMVDEREVTALHGVLRAELGAERAAAVSRDAGLRTGDYLLAHRIPRAVQAVLRVLPAPLASRVLLAAIRRHAWTFAGSGVFTAVAGNPVRVSIAGCPICRGANADGAICDYYAATFLRLFQKLVSRHATVTEIECEAAGDAACTFEIRLR